MPQRLGETLPGGEGGRRAGSASRRVAARSGYEWSPGLPQPDATTRIGVGVAPAKYRPTSPYAGAVTTPKRPHRPVLRSPDALEALGQGTDPIAQLHAAHETAAALLHVGRSAADPAVTERLVALVDDIGLPTLADLWAHRPAATLPGTLWRLYLLREWMLNDPDGAAREYAAGVRFTEPNHAVAGVDPPGPDEVRRVADAILRGAFTGDFAVALERASAFCHVVASGRADLSQGRAALDRAVKLQDMAHDLAENARLWRAGDLT